MNLVEIDIFSEVATQLAPFDFKRRFHTHEGGSIEAKRAYCSLLDRINFDEIFQSQSYDGSLDEVLNQLETSLSDLDSNKHLAELVLHPPRVIRAVIDYKVGQPEHNSQNSETLLREAISLGLTVYKGQIDAVGQLRRFREQVRRLGLESLLTNKLVQQSDMTTWHATHPEKSKSTARHLAELVNRGDVLFIAFAHGGVAAGMDVYLRYCEMTGSNSSEFYAVRFSQYKLKDKQPRLTPSEVEHLQSMAMGREVVIFDEDRASGGTMNKAYVFFASQVFPRRPIVTITNLDARAELMAQGLLNISNLMKNPIGKEHSIIKENFEKNVLSESKINQISLRENRSIGQILTESEGTSNKPQKGI